MRTAAWRRGSAVFGAVILGLAVVGPVAAVTPPVNDEASGAIDLGPSSSTIDPDLTNATSSPTDPPCGGGAKTVWYTFTPPDDGAFSIAPVPVDFLFNVGFLDGPPGQGTLRGCVQFPFFGFPVFAGHRYYVMVSSPGIGIVTVHLGFSASRIRLTADRDARLQADGSVVVTGTESCGEPEGFLNIDGSSAQPNESSQRTGTGGTFIQCPFEHPWSMTIVPDGRGFHAGRMSLTLKAIRCGLTHCDAKHLDATVWVRR